MRVMVIVKANEDSEAGVMPTQEMFEAMGKYNEEIVTQSYPAGVRARIKKRGGLTGKVIYLRGRELGSLYRRC